MDELIRKFNEWGEANTTHLNRQINIAGRHVANMKQWADLMNAYPAFPLEEKEVVYSMWRELSGIFEEFRELYTDFGDDAIKFKAILDLMQKEIDKLPND